MSAVPICVRLSPELAEKLDAKADESGLDRSAYLRNLVLRDLEGDGPIPDQTSRVMDDR